MASDPNDTTGEGAAIQSEEIPARIGGVSAIGSASAPFVFFDTVGAWGVEGSYAIMTLTAARLMPNPNTGEAVRDHVVTAHLRMTREGLFSLGEAIEKITAAAFGKPEGPAN